MSNTQENPIYVHIVSLGCAKNLVDSEVICGTLSTHNMCLVQEPEDADAIVINTCAFIKDARTEAENAIKKALKWKKAGLSRGYLRAVLVGGCMPQKEPETCMKHFPDVDVFFGLDEIARVHEMIQGIFDSAEKGSAPEKRDQINRALPVYLYDHTIPRLPGTPLPYANIKIAEGCNHRCAFCAIPGIRGNLRSRSEESVLEECRQLLDMGFTELDFIAQDTSNYGLDLKNGSNLAKLLKKCDALEGNFWIRVLYTHPANVNEELIDILGGGTRHVVPYLDMPLQHIADHILHDMRRNFSEKATRELIARIKTKYPSITLRTTFLTGFPGETEEDFQSLMNFVKETRFNRFGVFAFSPEKNTPAGEMTTGLVPEAIANQRRDQLMAAQRNISLDLNNQLIGQILPMIIDAKLSNTEFIARTNGDAPEVDQTVKLKMPAKAGVNIQEGIFLNGKITGAEAYQLRATAVLS